MRRWRSPSATPTSASGCCPSRRSCNASGRASASRRTRFVGVSQLLVDTLGHFNVTAHVIGTVSGPRVTRYELQLAPGIKVSRVTGLKADLAYALAATDIRVQAPIPGKTAVGVEVPNVEANYVSLGRHPPAVPRPRLADGLLAGQGRHGQGGHRGPREDGPPADRRHHGSGKSGCLNALISSVLLRATPDEVRMIMIDPKKVELSDFDGVPHLLAPVVTNPKQATYALNNLTREMDRRYDVLSRNGCQHIRALNKKFAQAGEEHMPYIMVIVDELADLMMVAPSEVEDSIIRLGQLGRSCGIHLVVATQRPSVDVVTGMIKTNIPSRIAFAVASQTDSRIILDQGGAESLLGMGDMLFSPMGSNRLLRVQGALITAHEMKLLTEHWKRQAKPEFREDLLENPAGPDAEQQAQAAGGDELLADAIKTVVGTGAASVALLQRRLRVGYARAGRLIDIMEEMGIISGYDGSKARAVLIDEPSLPPTLARVAGDARRRRRRPRRRRRLPTTSERRSPGRFVFTPALTRLYVRVRVTLRPGRARRKRSVVFEIGNTLREARVRRNLTFQQVEEDTKIRVKYVQAMENEDFDVMPGATYVRGFLRTYSEYLFARPGRHDRRIPVARRQDRRSPGAVRRGLDARAPHGHRGRNTIVFVAVICLLVLGVIWILGRGQEPEPSTKPGRWASPARRRRRRQQVGQAGGTAPVVKGELRVTAPTGRAGSRSGATKPWAPCCTRGP